VCIDTTNSENKEYFEQVANDARDYETIFNIFMNIDIKEFKPSNLPKTEFKKRL